MLRSDLWTSAFVRRHNDIGEICVVARKGDPIAGQIFIEIDHLNGTVSLLPPAPAPARQEGDEDRLFAVRFSHAAPDDDQTRNTHEAQNEQNQRVLSLDMRSDDAGVTLGKG